MGNPIGVFDSGYGGLTVLKELVTALPNYDFIYLGDNARAPYGNRSFETVQKYTLQCIEWFFELGCPLVILACNTASAKALRNIQQKELEKYGVEKRVLGVIRPTTESIGHYTKSNKVGILATKGTVSSDSYLIEIKKFFPKVEVFQEACPLWVPIIENNEMNSTGAYHFFKSNIENLLGKEKNIDTILLGCTHYPIIIDKINQIVGDKITILSQGKIVADSLKDYLKRHKKMDELLSKSATVKFYTTDDPNDFNEKAALFYGKEISSEQVKVD